jgi:hypothetical protein
MTHSVNMFSVYIVSFTSGCIHKQSYCYSLNFSSFQKFFLANRVGDGAGVGAAGSGAASKFLPGAGSGAA